MYFNRLRNYLKANSGRWPIGLPVGSWPAVLLGIRHRALGALCFNSISYFFWTWGLENLRRLRSVELTQSDAYYSIYLIVLFY